TAILVDGELAVWLEPRGKRMATGKLPAETIELALAVGLLRLAGRARRRELLIETIDGVVAGESPFARGLIAAGARMDYRGLVVRAPIPGVTAPVSRPTPADLAAASAAEDDDTADGDGDAEPDSDEPALP
nr:hypothetical protein [Myxococcota bacterium]